MGTPLYSTDIKTVPTRPELSALDAGDFYLVYDTSTGKISRINKTNAHAELVASIGANADDILLRENLSNKKSTLSENSEIYYPNQKAVNDGLATKLDVDSSGNITPAGIYLGGASSANLLDDYEEGTWTPTFLSQSGCGVSGITSIVRAIYIKIGFFVLVSSLIHFDSDITAVSPHNYIRIGGFPFAPTGETMGIVGTGAVSSSGMHGVIAHSGYIWGLNDRSADTSSLILSICYKTSS